MPSRLIRVNTKFIETNGMFLTMYPYTTHKVDPTINKQYPSSMWKAEATDRAPSIPNRAPNIDSSFKSMDVTCTCRITCNQLIMVML